MITFDFILQVRLPPFQATCGSRASTFSQFIAYILHYYHSLNFYEIVFQAVQLTIKASMYSNSVVLSIHPDILWASNFNWANKRLNYRMAYNLTFNFIFTPYIESNKRQLIASLLIISISDIVIMMVISYCMVRSL